MVDNRVDTNEIKSLSCGATTFIFANFFLLLWAELHFNSIWPQKALLKPSSLTFLVAVLDISKGRITKSSNIPCAFVSAPLHYLDYNSGLFPLSFVPPLFVFYSSDKMVARILPTTPELSRTERFIVQVNVRFSLYSNPHMFSVLSGNTIVF